MTFPPGYVPANGKRAPRKEWGESVYCILRGNENGPIVAKEPWPIATTVWVWQPDSRGEFTFAGDVIAVRKVEE